MTRNKPHLNDIELAKITVDRFWNDRTKGIPELRQFVAEAITKVRIESWEAGFEEGRIRRNEEYAGGEDEQ